MNLDEAQRVDGRPEERQQEYRSDPYRRDLGGLGGLGLLGCVADRVARLASSDSAEQRQLPARVHGHGFVWGGCGPSGRSCFRDPHDSTN
eukprot:scaffold97077_cov61-Phaeocystis_antarctica.AAC.3